MTLASRIKLVCLSFGVILITAGLNCPAFFDLGEGGMVTLRLENQSGLKVVVTSDFILDEFQVRQTVRRLDQSGPEADATLLPTRTRILRVVAVVSEEAEIPTTASLLKPGDVLAEGTFEWEVDFADGDLFVFVIPGLAPPPDFIDCNENDVRDDDDIASGTSQDCNANGIPDECEIGPPPQERLDASPRLLFPLDDSFTLAMEPNDDASVAVELGFDFQLFGQTYGSVYINNNGNLSFGMAFAQFTPTSFPGLEVPLIAPFWADVDTRDGLGDVRYKLQDNTLIVTWNDVGYFNQQGGKRNTFQVAISDGTNPVMGLGYNIVFSYGDMQWTTGRASGSATGFGGTAANVGADAGNGTNFFQIGRFDKPGLQYDGPSALGSGVDVLDWQVLRFNATMNRPAPVALGLPPGGIAVVNPSIGEFFASELHFLSPGSDQKPTLSVVDVDSAGQAGLLISQPDGNVAKVNLDWSPTCSNSGIHEVLVNVTDGVEPSLSSTIALRVFVLCQSLDCNGNGIPDECEPDCNGDGIPDDCTIAFCQGQAHCQDCNGNGIPDACDIASGFSQDINGNGIPDECEDPTPVENPNFRFKMPPEEERPGGPFLTEDFTGGAIQADGIIASGGVFEIPDDCYRAVNHTEGVCFTFEAAALGGSLELVGFTPTASTGEITIEPIDSEGQSLGTATLMPEVNEQGEVAPISVQYGPGISSIHIRSTSGPLSVDGLHYIPPQ